MTTNRFRYPELPSDAPDSLREPWSELTRTLEQLDFSNEFTKISKERLDSQAVYAVTIVDSVSLYDASSSFKNTIFVDTSLGAKKVTLPDPRDSKGDFFTIKIVNAASSVTVSARNYGFVTSLTSVGTTKHFISTGTSAFGYQEV